MKKFLENKKRLWIILGVLVALVGACLACYFFIYRNPVVATVGEKKITRDELSLETENAQTIAEYMGADTATAEATAKQTLIERALMDIAAQDYDISVTDEEVAADIESNSSIYGSVEELQAAYSYAYGLDGEELSTTVYYKLLRIELESKILSDKNGRMLYARFNENNAVEELIGIETSELDSWASEKANSWLTTLESGTSFDSLYNTVRTENKYPAYYGDVFTLNELTDMDDSEESAIRGTAIDTYSGVTKQGTYYAIYYVDEAAGGVYDSWSAFVDDYSNKYVKYPLLTYGQASAIQNAFDQVVSFIAPSAANAACSACSGCRGAGISGYVRDGTTNIGIVNATVTGTSSSSNFCNGSSSSSVTGWCGYRTGSGTSTSTGTYTIARQDGFSCRFNCAGGTVSFVASAPGYFARTYNNSGSGYTVTNGSTFNISMLLYVNQPPTVTPTNPMGTRTSPAIYNIVTNNTIFINATATDPEGHQVKYQSVYKKSTDNGATWSSWVYSPSSTTYTTLANSGTARTVVSYVPSNLGVGLYYWVVKAADAEGIVNLPPDPVNFPGNPFNHNNPQYFKIVNGYSVTYNGNGSTGGTVPTDANYYTASSSVTVKGNTGALIKTGYTFGGWNTNAAGTGTSYAAGSTYTMGSANVILYAKWTANPLSCTVTPQAGLSPLVVSVNVVGGVSPYDYDMDYKINDVVQAIVYEYVDRSTPVYYTYQQGASYQIRVQDAGGTVVACTPNAVTVTDPTDSSGGEVSP